VYLCGAVFLLFHSRGDTIAGIVWQVSLIISGVGLVAAVVACVWLVAVRSTLRAECQRLKTELSQRQLQSEGPSEKPFRRALNVKIIP